MKAIPLTRGYVAIVDDEDYDDISCYKWHVVFGRHTVYAARRSKGREIAMHRHLTGATQGQIVDHENQQGWDNRRQNLRICSASQNSFNSKNRINKKSKFRGVRYRKRNNKWQATVQIQGKSIHLGTFPCEVQAAQAYDSAIQLYAGDFAVLNFPPNYSK